MEDEAIRELLRTIRRPDHVEVPPGHFAVLRRSLREASVDVAAVERWLDARGAVCVAAAEPIPSGAALWRESSRDAIAYVVSSALISQAGAEPQATISASSADRA